MRQRRKTMFEFSIPWLFLAVPLPILMYFLCKKADHVGAGLRVPFFDSIASWQKGHGNQLKWFRWVVLLLIWLLLVTAAAQPKWVGEQSQIPVSGRDLMLAVDVSGSMKALDMIYNNRPEDRLSAVRRVAGEFIERRIGDRIGLILFGTRAYLQAPLSLDRKTVNALLQEAVIGIAGEKTAIGDAIGLALKRLNARPDGDKVLILLTDGTQTAGSVDPIKAAQLATLGELKIYTIGVGANAQISQSIFGTSFFGQRSDLDEETLKAIANQTGGQYFRAIDAQSLNKIYQTIDKLEPVEEEYSDFKPITSLFYWPLGLGLLLSFLWAGWAVFGDFWSWLMDKLRVSNQHNTISAEKG